MIGQHTLFIAFIVMITVLVIASEMKWRESATIVCIATAIYLVIDVFATLGEIK